MSAEEEDPRQSRFSSLPMYLPRALEEALIPEDPLHEPIGEHRLFKITKDKEMATALQTNLRRLFKEESCTDFEVHVEDRTFPCHRAVLVAMSDYFAAMLSSGMQESTENVVTLHDIKPDIFELILKLIYGEDTSGDVLVKLDEVDELLKASCMLQISKVQEICERFLVKTLRPESCISIWRLAQNLQCATLEKDALDFILKNFTKLASHPDFLSLTLKDLLRIIHDDRLDSKSGEDEVCEAAFAWIGEDQEARAKHVGVILQQLCLGQVSMSYLMEELAFHPLVRHDDTSAEVVKDAVRYKLHKELHGQQYIKLRATSQKEQLVVLLGKPKKGGQKGIINMNCFSQRKNTWYRLKPLPNAGEDYACCVYGSSLFVSGGSGKPGMMYEYDGRHDKWTRREDMPLHLQNHAMVPQANFLFVLGGISGSTVNGQVMRFSLVDEKWEVVGQLMVPVEGPSTVNLGKRILIFGGKLSEGEATNCVQSFDTNSGEEGLLCNLPSPSAFTRAVSKGKVAYVVTEHGEIIQIFEDSMEASVLAQIPNFDRRNFGVEIRKDELCIFGGVYGAGEVEGELSSDITCFNLSTAKFSAKKCLPSGFEVFGSGKLVVSSMHLTHSC